MTPQKYADELAATPCEVVDVYDRVVLNDVFIEGANRSVRHSLRHFWVQNALADLIDICFQAE